MLSGRTCVLFVFAWTLMSLVHRPGFGLYQYTADALLRLRFHLAALPPAVLHPYTDIAFFPRRKYIHRGSRRNFHYDNAKPIQSFWSTSRCSPLNSDRAVNHSVLASLARSANTFAKSDSTCVNFGLLNIRSLTSKGHLVQDLLTDLAITLKGTLFYKPNCKHGSPFKSGFAFSRQNYTAVHTTMPGQGTLSPGLGFLPTTVSHFNPFLKLAENISPGEWSEMNGFELEGFPSQDFEVDCGIYMLMLDMPKLRKWWCLLLMENFDLRSYGKVFAHWTKESEAVLRGEHAPVFRLRKRKSVELSLKPAEGMCWMETT
ncbi:uncharacterized protein LOC125725672 [Brienomyrus brachyistius]|uniref:uncharacterized protein LOC125725672 n=1 Tax=Brienomyrus brachyistius TaxID=42636 RepID=UPI0020B3F63E|nr:uncharacterized protein LOC125725672 [Brienomyrus brachyistius]